MSTTSTHPLILAAAASVILASGVGIAHWLGYVGNTPQPSASAPALIASSTATASPTPTLTATPSPTPTASPTPSPTATPTPTPSKKPKYHPKPTPVPVAADLVWSKVPTSNSAVSCPNCGQITHIETIQADGEGSAAGVLLGGAAGGVIGNQIGKGNGKTAARILGAIGGALIGNQVEKRVNTQTHYEVTAQFADGSTRTIQYPHMPALRVGQRVKLINGELVEY
ncbi:glycine zipper 2TM domain-containing protein [Deefgea salmonis]|uniref:Glycine zipper 2TM domain-containing protein n=1 Tax=Deefgea salmonis TaxID=2875502 RepID=A0ABS8BLY7_9NEIS|nr:glycine zipper 2TM domain-containing protein [Deefgea salmonis]MCB5196743.1 glycine zipper 2TM domain-containing protein [Deefgea salmonis]